MAVEVISEGEVRDELASASYPQFASASIVACGRRYLAWAAEPPWGRPAEGKIVNVKFPSMQRARK